MNLKRVFVLAIVAVLLALTVSGVSADDGIIKGGIIISPNNVFIRPPTIPIVMDTMDGDIDIEPTAVQKVREA